MKTNVLKTAMMLVAFVVTGIFSEQLTAQTKYGGSSYAYVKDSKGNTRVVMETTACVWSNESEAKKYLKPSKAYDEEFQSEIHYSINACKAGDTKKYGGSSSARVKNKNGKTRVVTSTTSCVWSTAAEAKQYLIPSKAYDEEFDSPISYDIDSCSR